MLANPRPRSSEGFIEDFPKIIWQKGPEDLAKQWVEKTATWSEQNPDWSYNLVDDVEMDRFVRSEYAHQPSIVGVWSEIRNSIWLSDIWRYLVLLARGGVYSDLDTSDFKPIDQWIPAEFRGKANVVAGLEYADTTYRIFPRNVSFCQWTLMTKPHHPVFEVLVQKVLSRIEYAARVKKVNISDLELSREETLAATGPGAFSDAVLATIRDNVGDSNMGWETFFGMQSPRLFGDILVLPINAFGTGQKHSNSSKPEYGEAFARHHFGSSWFKKAPPKDQVPAANAPLAVQHAR